MENLNTTDKPEILDIKTKLEAIHKDVRLLKEKSNQEYFNIMLTHLKTDLVNSIIIYLKDDFRKDLERNMINPCQMRDSCQSKFTEFLDNNVELLKQDNVLKDTLDEKKVELNEFKKTAPFDKCDTCFSEVNSLFDKEINLINSLQIYKSNEDNKFEIEALHEDLIVKSVLEPLSSKLRLQILKSMSSQTRTFSALSDLTGLRGGNLLFHLQKLSDGELILQRHERGDYMITEKGLKLLLLLTDIQKIL